MLMPIFVLEKLVQVLLVGVMVIAVDRWCARKEEDGIFTVL